MGLAQPYPQLPGGMATDHTFLSSTDTPAPPGRCGGRSDTR